MELVLQAFLRRLHKIQLGSMFLKYLEEMPETHRTAWFEKTIDLGAHWFRTLTMDHYQLMVPVVLLLTWWVQVDECQLVRKLLYRCLPLSTV